MKLGVMRAATGGVAVAAFVGAAWLASSLPQPPPVGIPDPGLVTRWGIPLATLVRNLSASMVIGLAVIGLLMRTDLTPSTHRALTRVGLVAALATVASLIVLYLLTTSDVYSLPISQAFAADGRTALYDETEIGRRLAQQIVLWLVLSLTLLRCWPWSPAASLVLALVSLVPWAYGGHSAASGDHRLAVYSILLHLISVTIWFGGICGVLWAARAEPVRTVMLMRRFSPVALAAFVLVATSGMVASWARLPGLDSLWQSGYGQLILIKSGLLVVLCGFGVCHRRTVLRRTNDHGGVPTGAVVRVVAVEMLVMAAAMGVAVALSRTPMS